MVAIARVVYEPRLYLFYERERNVKKKSNAAAKHQQEGAFSQLYLFV
jgi:hypothetical protein